MLDHLIGDREHPRWNCQAERRGGLEIEYPLELGRLLDWDVALTSLAWDPVEKVGGAAV